MGQWQKLLSSRPTPSQSDASLTVAVGGRGWGHRGGGPLCVATEKNVKIAKVHSITSCFGHEDVVKTKLFIKFMKRTRTKLSITIEHFKISQIEEELELPKVWLKLENQKIILHKTGPNFVKIT